MKNMIKLWFFCKLQVQIQIKKKNKTTASWISLLPQLNLLQCLPKVAKITQDQVTLNLGQGERSLRLQQFILLKYSGGLAL